MYIHINVTLNLIWLKEKKHQNRLIHLNKHRERGENCIIDWKSDTECFFRKNSGQNLNYPQNGTPTNNEYTHLKFV